MMWMKLHMTSEQAPHSRVLAWRGGARQCTISTIISTSICTSISIGTSTSTSSSSSSSVGMPWRGRQGTGSMKRGKTYGKLKDLNRYGIDAQCRMRSSCATHLHEQLSTGTTISEY